MKDVTTADRLKQIMQERNIRQVDILKACEPFCEKYGVKLAKNDLSQYVSGKVTPGEDKLMILGLALNVSEVWLMGYDVPIESEQSIDEQETFRHFLKALGYEVIYVDVKEEGGKFTEIQYSTYDSSRHIKLSPNKRRFPKITHNNQSIILTPEEFSGFRRDFRNMVICKLDKLFESKNL